MPKAFMNKAGKLLDKSGKTTGEPFIVYDEGKAKPPKDAKLVEVDVIIDKPQPRYVIKKGK